jgi:peroxiredoxin
LSDEDKIVGSAYEVVRESDDPFRDFPQRISYLIDPQGVIQKAYAVTDPAGHGAEVLADLTALLR